MIIKFNLDWIIIILVRMSVQNLQRLIQQTYRMVPEFAKPLQAIPDNKLYLNYPLQLVTQRSKSIFPNSSNFLKSSSLIRPNNHIFLVESNQFFSSSNFAGATSSQEQSLNEKLQQLKSKYEIFDQDMIARIKLTLSIQANMIDDSMRLNAYAKYVLKQKKNPSIQNFIKIHANSGFLKSVINSNKLAVTTAYDYLNKSFLKSVKFDDFNNAYELVRFYSKQTNKLRVVFPFCNNIKHSFQPNCELKAIFLMHRRETFLTIDSVRQILPGEELTINYGNSNNYELFIRYGFALENNPFSQFYLPIDFSEIDEIFNANIDWKMQMFKKNKQLKLKNFVRINIHGKIHSDDLNMLKIVFSTTPLTRQQFSEQSQTSQQLSKQIYSFVKKTAQKFLVMNEKMIEKRKQLTKGQSQATLSQNQEVIMKNIQIIQNEEKQILKTLIKEAQIN